MSIKFLVRNDLHNADRPPLGRTESYMDDILAKQEETFDIADRTGCDFIVDTGDWFHKFRGVVNINRLLVRLVDLYRRRPCEIYGVGGNHDFSYSGADSAFTMPFGVMVKSGALNWLDEARVIEPVKGGEKVLLVPRNWEPYIDNLSNIFKLKKDEVAMRPKNGYTIMVAHAMILPPGQDAIYPHHNADKLPTELLHVLLCGHDHRDLGIHQLPSGCWYANIGSVARVERTKHNLERRPEVLTVTLDHGEIEFERHPLMSARPAEEVFFDQEVAPERQLGDFAENLASSLELEETPLEELIARYTKDDPKEVVARLRYYLTKAEED
jgi:DNA repair exonuclease SbcCD nuclease subunit